MRTGRQNIALVGVLVLLLAVIAYVLRTPDDGTDGSDAGPAKGTTASPSPGEASAPTASPSLSPSPTQIAAVVFLGDSFAAGSGASTPDRRWTTILSGRHGWTEVNLAAPKTGYLRAGHDGGCTPQTCQPYSALVAQAIAAEPQLVLITGGANDLREDLGNAGVALQQTLADLRAGLPAATIVVVNPWWDMRREDPHLAEWTETIKVAASASGAVFADTGQPLTGQAALVTADGLNANDAGHAALADVVDAALRLAGLTP